MLRVERHDDVTRLVFETSRSRSINYSVSAYSVRGALVDSAFPTVRGDLLQWLDANPASGVIVTHYHEDHAGNAEALAARGLPMWISPATLDHIRRPATIGRYRRWTWGSQPPLVSTPAPFGHAALEMIHTPGHSADHHVVWDAERETVFGADLYLGVKVRVSHPWPREDVRGTIASIRRVIALKPKRYFDGHRGLVRDPITQLTAKADWTEETVGRIDALIAKGWSDRAIAKEVLGAETLLNYGTMLDYSARNIVGSVRATRAR